MKVKETLDKRGIVYKELKEDPSRFLVHFEIEIEKNKAIRALVKDDCIITNESQSESGWKIQGLKKNDSKLAASDNAVTDIHATDPARLRAEIKGDIKC